MSGRVLVIKLSAFGDIIQATGAMAAIRTRHHADHVIALTTRPFAPLFAAMPYFDEVWIDERPAVWQIAGWLALRQRLIGGRFDWVYDLQTSERSSTYFHLMGPGRRPNWSGIARGASHRHDNSARDHLHTLDRLADQLRFAGIDSVPPPDLAWLHADIGRFNLAVPFVLLVPGASAHRPGKRWPVERYAELARRLAAGGSLPIVIGGAMERALGESIRHYCGAARDLTGETTYAEIASLARSAAAAVGNDTGPLQLIAFAGTPSVVLFSGQSDPALAAPRGAKVRVLRRAPIAELGVDKVAAALGEFGIACPP